MKPIVSMSWGDTCNFSNERDHDYQCDNNKILKLTFARDIVLTSVSSENIYIC